jgi:hypothetical protein
MTEIISYRKAQTHGVFLSDNKKVSLIMHNMKIPKGILKQTINIIEETKKWVKYYKIILNSVVNIRKFLGNPDIELIDVFIMTLDTIYESEFAKFNFHEWRMQQIKRYPIMLPKPVLTGNDLIRNGFKPGKELKLELERIYNQQLINEEI